MLIYIRSIDHIELTVKDLLVSSEFYKRLPGFKVVASYPNFIMFSCGNFKLGLTDHKGRLTSDSFKETNIGMDHVSFTVSKREDLDEAIEFFSSENIPHGEIKKLSNGTYVLAFRDPDNIQLELTYK